MSGGKSNSEDQPVRGAAPSIITDFGIRGLYGYRNISLHSEHAATILIARNGTGKTTLLGALDAFLRMQLSRLRNLEFSEIHCTLAGVDEELKLTHSDVIDFLQIQPEGEISKWSSRASIDVNELFHFIIDEWPSWDKSKSPTENRIYGALYSALNYNYKELQSVCERINDSLIDRIPSIRNLKDQLGIVLGNYDIVYLPTYRRVELSLRGDPQDGSRTRKKKPKLDIATGSLFTGDIQFGLSDISERLSEMNQQIIFESNRGYRNISANIINDLIDGTFEKEPESTQSVPNADELQLFFSRIERGRRTGPFYPETLPNLDKIYSREGVAPLSGKFLTFFLNQLSIVINATKDVELPIDGFINHCNKYLCSSEPSTDLSCDDQTQRAAPIDGKRLRLNRSNLRVHVESVPEGRRISLDALSSGEKQMISLFAKLFLYPGRKIVLIDEPELSLSIDWQRQIIVDVLNAPLCDQVIAITHSPFVFDNELEPFARALKLSADVSLPVKGDESDEEDASE